MKLNINRSKPQRISEEGAVMIWSQMLESPPEGLGPREWFTNVNEEAKNVSYDVTGYVEALDFGQVKKLVLRDDGPGMPAFDSDNAGYSLQKFVTEGASSGDHKNAALDGNQGRGFRFAWSHFNPEGILVYTKQDGGPTYMAGWKKDGDNYYPMEPVVDPAPAIELGDHGTAFIMLGQDAMHDTVDSPFPGWQDFVKGGVLFASMLTRRVYQPKAKLQITASSMQVGGEEGKGHIAKKVSFLGIDLQNSKLREEHDIVTTPEGLKIEWIKIGGPRWEERKRFLFGGADLGSFGAVNFQGDMIEWVEGTSGWVTEAEAMVGDLSYVAEDVSVIVHIPDTPEWRGKVKQSFDREKLEWRSHTARNRRHYKRGKNYGSRVVVMRAFDRELCDPQHQPQWLQDMIEKRKQDRKQTLTERQRERFKKHVDKYKLMLDTPGGPGRQGDPKIMRPLLRSGSDKREGGKDNWFKGTPHFEVIIKPMHAEHEARYPVSYIHDEVNKSWEMHLSLNSWYVQKALDAGAKKMGYDDYTSMEPNKMAEVRQAAEHAASITLANHFMFIQLHLMKGYFTQDEADQLLHEPPHPSVAMAHFFDWVEAVPVIIQEDYIKPLDAAA